MESRLLLNVVVGQGTTILELLASKDKALLVGRNAACMREQWPPITTKGTGGHSPLLVLNLGLDIVDGVGRLHLKGDSLPREGLDEDLHLHVRSTSGIESLLL